MYHIVFPAKYRGAVFNPQVDEKIKEICLEIEKRYEINFLEIGTDSDHVHFRSVIGVASPISHFSNYDLN